MTGVLNTTSEWLALQWACNHLFGTTGFVDLTADHDPVTAEVLEHVA